MTQTYKERAANLPTGLWSCDANGSPCDAYTARWKMEDLAADYTDPNAICVYRDDLATILRDHLAAHPAAERPAQGEAGPTLKDNEIAAIVNHASAIAKQYGGTDQCRERLSQLLVPILKGTK